MEPLYGTLLCDPSMTLALLLSLLRSHVHNIHTRKSHVRERERERERESRSRESHVRERERERELQPAWLSTVKHTKYTHRKREKKRERERERSLERESYASTG